MLNPPLLRALTLDSTLRSKMVLRVFLKIFLDFRGWVGGWELFQHFEGTFEPWYQWFCQYWSSAWTSLSKRRPFQMILALGKQVFHCLRLLTVLYQANMILQAKNQELQMEAGWKRARNSDIVDLWALPSVKELYSALNEDCNCELCAPRATALLGYLWSLTYTVNSENSCLVRSQEPRKCKPKNGSFILPQETHHVAPFTLPHPLIRTTPPKKRYNTIHPSTFGDPIRSPFSRPL